MIKQIKSDLYRYTGKISLLIFLRYFLFTPGFRYSVFYRLTHGSHFFTGKCFWWFFMRLSMYRTGIQIPYQTMIGYGLRISHFGSIIINPLTKIGNNCTLSSGVLIGNSDGKSKGIPTIGNNVCVQVNAVIVGGITIGDNVLIAPNAFVNFNVPANSIVIGNPAKIIEKDNASHTYMTFFKNEY